MAATFPNGIASFSEKRNLLDDVDASDINRLQDEIIAVQSTLGALITEVASIENEVQVLEEADAAADDLTQAQNITRFRSLKERLDAIQKGQHVHAVDLQDIKATSIKKSDKPRLSEKPGALKFNKPSTPQDPFKMYNGSGFTLRKAGFWHIQGFVLYDLADRGQDGVPANYNLAKNAGLYQAAIGVGNAFAVGMDRQEVVKDAVQGNVFLSPSRLGWFPAGTRITLRTSQASDSNQIVRKAALSAVLLRGPYVAPTSAPTNQ